MHIPVFRKKVFMNLFETVKTAISVGQAAKRYGLTVGKNGMCCCPFHADKTPSMKLNEAYYYCFGCKAHGDVIALTAQLLHLPPGSAAAELAQAFHVDISACQGRGKERRRQHYQPDTVALAHQLAAIREKDTDRERDVWLKHAQKVLTTYLRLLRTWKERYAPRPGEDVWHPLFQEACQREAWVEGLLAQSDDPLERDFLYNACKKEVDAIAERITRDQLGTAHERERAG